MKKLIKTATKILSLILSVLMIVTVLPMQVFATEVIDTDPFANFTAKENAPAIQNEIVDKRTPYSKVFATEDGGYYTIVSTTPIHIEDENGVLQDIAEAPADLTSEESISNFATGNEFQTPSTWNQWQNMLLLALIPTVLSNLTLVLAIQKIGSTMTSILGSMEPLTAVLVGVFRFGESFSLDTAIGLILIISAVMIVILNPGRTKRHTATA